VGGCEIRLSDNTTFLVKEVDEDYTIISVLDVELELDRGTIIECAFGSLDMTCVQGAVAVRPEPGFIQVIIITLPDGKKVQTTLTDGATFDIQPNASGDFVIVNTGTTPIEFTPIDPISGEPAGDPVPVAAGEEAGEELALLTDGGTVTEILIPEPPADEPPPTDAPLLGTSPGTTTTSVSVGLGN
jgi:hypothetical protein